MKFKTIVKTKNFWPSVFLLAVAFLVIYHGIDIFNYDFDFSAYYEAKIANGRILRFIVANLASGFVYGFVVAFLQFRGKLKRAEKNQQ